MPDEISVQFDTPATMRDGTVLKANIYRPATEGEYPVALTRTPYGKNYIGGSSQILDVVRLARSGYIVVVQDVRGRMESEGEWRPFEHEALDGYDTVEWAAKLPGSSGKVGMWGISYFGYTQWATAIMNPPSLKAIMPGFTWADFMDGTTWRGGAFELGTMAEWNAGAVALDVLLKRQAGIPPEEKAKALGIWLYYYNTMCTQGYFSLPLKDFAPLKNQGLAAEFFDTIDKPFDQQESERLNISQGYRNVTVPSYNFGGWYDLFLGGTLRNFGAMHYGGMTPETRQSKLLIGPWSHVNYNSVIGNLDFGFTAAASYIELKTDLTGLTQRWFDYWLKGRENGILTEPPVKIFVMGENVWRDEEEWPIRRAVYTSYYLHSGGSLSTETPGITEPSCYIYDPSDPTPSWGGPLLLRATYGAGAQDQRKIEHAVTKSCAKEKGRGELKR